MTQETNDKKIRMVVGWTHGVRLDLWRGSAFLFSSNALFLLLLWDLTQSAPCGASTARKYDPTADSQAVENKGSVLMQQRSQ